MSITIKTLYLTKYWTPLFNIPENPFKKIPLEISPKGLLKSRETLLFPKTKVECLSFLTDDVVEIKTDDYSSSHPLYTDLNFLKKFENTDVQYEKKLPSQEEILQWLKNQLGAPYCWGGNCIEGIKQIMIKLYPHLTHISVDQHINAYCLGADCSGFLYQATNGITPRNTSDFIHYGTNIPIENLSAIEVQKKLEPLDVILFEGHMIICLDKNQVIESVITSGVVISTFTQRFAEMQQLAQKYQKSLHLVRWYETTSKIDS